MRENSNGIQIAANTKTKSEEGVDEEGRGVEREAREREREREAVLHQREIRAFERRYGVSSNSI